jgi:hypothetical protein
MNKELDLLKQYIDISQLPVGWEDEWQKSQASYPGNDLFFLQKPFIQEAGEMSGLSPDAIQAMNYAAEKLAAAPGILQILWHTHFLFFKEEQYPRDAILPFLNIKGMEEKVLSLVDVLVLFSGYPEMKKNYQNKGISEQILRDTLLDIAIWMDDFKVKNGYWGFKALGWLMNHLQGKLFRIGRLQYMPATFKGNIHVYRNINNHEIVVFSEPDIQYRTDGLINGTNDINENTGLWTAELKESGVTLCGNPINSHARAVNHFEEISLTDYKLVLKKGDPIMEVHIPAGQPLNHDDCIKSYQAAISFYEEFFPEIKFNGFCCTSWLLDNQLSLLLPAKSNIVQFQQDYFIYPYKGTDAQTFERVFGGKPADLANAPRNTPLQAAILDYCLKGNHMRMGAGFILKQWVIDGKLSP